MRLERFAVPVLLSLALSGCGIATNQTPATSPQPSPPVVSLPDTEVEAALTEAEANAIMAEVVAAINQENVAYLQPYLLERDRTVDHVEAALADYQTHFNNEPISRFELTNIEQLGTTGNQIPIQRFNYQLYNASGTSKAIALYQDQSLRLNDEFFNYSYWAEALMERFTNAVAAENAEQLAQVLNADDQPYPVANAREAIATYRANFDLNTLDYRFEQLSEGSQGFDYTITGTRNGQPVEHAVTVIYGDGLVGLRDEFIPERTATN